MSDRMTYVVSIVRSTSGLSELQTEWEQLYEDSAFPNPFLSYGWTRACWDNEEGQVQPFVLAARDSERLVGLTPLCIERRSGFRVLRFIAEERSDYLGFLCSREIPDMEAWLLGALMGYSQEWDLAVFRQLAEPYTELDKIASDGVQQWHDAAWTTAAYCRWGGDWDSLHKAGPSWLREMRKRHRRFQREGWTIEHFTGSDAADRLPVVSEIEASSWKGQQGVARLQRGPGQNLLRCAFESPDIRDQIQLWLASIGGKAVAFQIDFIVSDRLWLYQCSYDEEYRKTGAGSVLAYLAVGDAWRGGVREYDYLSGDEPYKLQRTNALRTIHYAAVHRRNLRGWLAYGLLLAPRWKLRQVSWLKFAYQQLMQFRRKLAHTGASAPK